MRFHSLKDIVFFVSFISKYDMPQIKIFFRILLSIAFLFSAYTKWIAPGFFEITLVNQGLIGNRELAGLLARLLIGLEITQGILLLLPYYLKKVLLFTLVILAGLTFYLIYLWGVGNTENCGCFGEMIAMSPMASILKNSIMISLAGFLLLKTKERNKPSLIPLFILTGVVSIVFVFLPLKNMENFPFQSFTNFKNKGVVDLSEGKKLLAVFNLDCEHCQAAAMELGNLKDEHKNFPATYVLYFQEGTTTVAAFEEQTKTDFPYALIDATQFFDLIGNSPPRIYFLNNGTIEQVWDDDFRKSIESQFFSK